MTKTSHIDSQMRSEWIEEGDEVRILEERTGHLSKWVGTVTAVVDSIGMVDVETPFGNERYRSELIQPESGAPDYEDTSYSSWDSRSAAEVANSYLRRVGGQLKQAASHLLEAGVEPVRCYDRLFRSYSDEYSDSEIRDAMKLAMYWKEKGRQYIPTLEEEEKGTYFCPRCDEEELVKANYKKHTKLLACPKCFFLIRPEDIVDRSRPDDEGGLKDRPSLPEGKQDLADAIWEKAKSAGMEDRLAKLVKNEDAPPEAFELLSIL